MFSRLGTLGTIHSSHCGDESLFHEALVATPGPEQGQELPSSHFFWEKLGGWIIVGFILPCLLEDCDGVQCLPSLCTAKISQCRDGRGAQ